MRISDWSSDVCSSDLHRFSCLRAARMIGLSLPPKAPIMSTYDDFEPRLGRLGDKGQKPRPRKFLSRVIAAANLARGGAPGRARQSAFTGSRIGRGAGRSAEHTTALQSPMRITYAGC